ncbi:helix-turn-helix domain-containing protein [Corynebacterium striatum]
MTIVGHMTNAIGSTGIVPMWDVTDRIRKAREVAGLKQSELAAELGMSRTVIAAVEQGVRAPRRGELIAISFATGVSLEWLENSETPAPEGPGGGSECAIRDLNPEPTD